MTPTFAFKWLEITGYDESGHPNRDFLTCIVCTVAFLLMIIMTGVLLWFFEYHIRLLIENMTTLEDKEKKEKGLDDW